MKRFKLKSFLFAALLVVTSLASCGGSKGPSNDPNQPVDYASQLKLDMNSGSAKQEVTVRNNIDGDTTHFHFDVPADKVGSEEMDGVLDGILKARYLGVDTPESTGKVQPWGKAASNFTKEHLNSATSIVIESETLDGKWNKDSTGGRYLVWVWYKNDNAEDTKYHDYRLLNLELMQEGLAWSRNDVSYRYYEPFNNAMKQANSLLLKVWGDAKDPDYYYGAAQEVTLKYLRETEVLNEETGEIEHVNRLEEYKDQKVRVTGIVYRIAGSSIYLQEDDPETGNTYGIQAYLGPGGTLTDCEVGAKFNIVGTLGYFEAGCYYQISGVKDRGFFEVADDESSRVDDEIYPTNPKVITFSDYTERRDQNLFANTKLENLKVVKVYTTKKPGSPSWGAMTLTCKDPQGNEIMVRTQVLTGDDGKLVTESAFKGKTITIVGMIQPFKPEDGDLTYQFELYSMKDVTYVD